MNNIYFNVYLNKLLNLFLILSMQFVSKLKKIIIVIFFFNLLSINFISADINDSFGTYLNSNIGASFKKEDKNLSNDNQMYAIVEGEFSLKNFLIKIGIGTYNISLKQTNENKDQTTTVSPGFNLMYFGYCNAKLLNFNIEFDLHRFDQSTKLSKEASELKKDLEKADNLAAYSFGGTFGYDLEILNVTLKPYLSFRYYFNDDKKTAAEYLNLIKNANIKDLKIDNIDDVLAENSILFYGYGAKGTIELGKIEFNCSIGLNFIKDKNFKGIFLTSHIIREPFFRSITSLEDSIKYADINLKYISDGPIIEANFYIDSQDYIKVGAGVNFGF